MYEQKPYIVGLSGGSASGKTTFIHQLKEQLQSKITVISQDHYYKTIEHQIVDENGYVNFDLPECIDFDKLETDINAIINNKAIEIIEYTFQNENKKAEKIILEPSNVIIIEGLFIFYQSQISKYFDLKIFIDADDNIKYQRRLQRDLNERGLSETMIAYQWQHHVKPAFQNYLLPFQSQVDVIILNNTHFENALNMIVNHLKTF